MCRSVVLVFGFSLAVCLSGSILLLLELNQQKVSVSMVTKDCFAADRIDNKGNSTGINYYKLIEHIPTHTGFSIPISYLQYSECKKGDVGFYQYPVSVFDNKSIFHNPGIGVRLICIGFIIITMLVLYTVISMFSFVRTNQGITIRRRSY